MIAPSSYHISCDGCGRLFEYQFEKDCPPRTEFDSPQTAELAFVTHRLPNAYSNGWRKAIKHWGANVEMHLHLCPACVEKNMGDPSFIIG